MKGTKYNTIDTLPKDAVKVSQYAKDNNITVAYVYIKHSRGKAKYNIVSFQGINFIIQ